MQGMRKRQGFCGKGTGEQRKVKVGQEVHQVLGAPWWEERTSTGRTSSDRLL